MVKNETSKVNQKAYSSGPLVKTLNTEILSEDLTVCEEWSLSIDIKLPNRSIPKWKKVFSIQVNETVDFNGNSSIPTVWIRPDQSNIMLMIAYNTNNSQSYEYNITKKVNAGNWINLKLSQKSGLYEIMVDYKLVYNKTKFVPETWTTVNLVTGDINIKDNNSTIVHYRNFNFNTCKRRGKYRK